MDKIKFARLINVLSHWGMREISTGEMIELDQLIAPNDVAPTERPIVSAVDVETLMKCMQEKTHKIEAIKTVRQITNLGLKEAKDLVERYWV